MSEVQSMEDGMAEEAFADSVRSTPPHSPPYKPDGGDIGFNLETELTATPGVEVGVVKVPVRDTNGRLRHFTRDGETFPVTVTIHNSYTQLAQKVDAHMRRDKVRGSVTYGTLYQRQIYKLSRCTTGWDGIVDSKGNPVPFSRSVMEQLYKNNPYLRKDALEALEDDGAGDFFED